mgnify:CR=1 FL=1
MSFSEILVILIVSIFCITPQDLKEILAKIQQIKKFVKSSQQKINSYLELDEERNHGSIMSDFGVDEINTYLAKILSLGHEYSGEYNIDDIKKYYDSIAKPNVKPEEQ